MFIFDAILLIILAGFVFYGLFKGFVKMVFDFLGFIAGIWVASHYYIQFAQWLQGLGWGSENLMKVIAFVVLFAVTAKVAGIVFALLEKFFKIISIIPFAKTINRIIGATLGLALGSLSLSVVIFLLASYTSETSNLAKWLSQSGIVPWLLKVGNLLMPLLPEAFEAVKTIIA
ncbi:MAG: CvpA family protein [Candidatus Pacebacteria bacterium]|nr:CvpA family protein [Candidatus Paceibacterota bacterium]